jgi:hypothetical protein
MNGQQVDTEKFTSIDDIINFYTQDQAHELQHSDLQKTELDQEETEDHSFHKQES